MPTAASPASAEMQLRHKHGDAGKEHLDSAQDPHAILIENLLSGASLVVQGLRHRSSNSGGCGLNPW